MMKSDPETVSNIKFREKSQIDRDNEVFECTLRSFKTDFIPFTEKFRLFCKNKNVNQSKVFDMEVSIEELIVNSFAYGDSVKRGGVKVEIRIVNKELIVKIEDQAPPFNLLIEAPDPPKGDLSQRKAGGLGIHLVKNLSDKIEYSGSKKGNKITLFFKNV